MRRPAGRGLDVAQVGAPYDRVRLTAWVLAAAGCTGFWAVVAVAVHALV